MARVLLADDNDDTVLSLSMILADDGHQVETARDGGEAMLKLGTFRPDVVLLDLYMPVINGWEFLDAKSRVPDPVVREIPVVVISGWKETSQPIESEGVMSQVKTVLDKPADPEVIKTVVSSVVSARPSPQSRQNRPRSE